jgi:hypothetical protein
MSTRPVSWAVVVTLGCMMLSACSRESTPDSYGVVAGHLQLVGGPVNVTIPVAGSITVQGDVERTVEVGSDGVFSIAVPPGRYLLTGHSPQYGGGEGLCGRGAKPVVVKTGVTTSVDVACDML